MLRRPSTRTAIVATKVALAMILVGLVVVGRRNTCWPLGNWGMYSRRPIEVKSHASAWRVRVTDGSGNVTLVAPHELWDIDRATIAQLSFERAFTAEDESLRAQHKAYLVHMLDVVRPSPAAARIEGLQMTWDVEPLSVPPLKLDQPAQVVSHGSFAADPYRSAREVR